MNIKLISPRMSLRPMDTEMKRRMAPPLSLVTIASMTPKQHTVYIEDENVGALHFDDSPDLVGITVNVDTVYRAAEIAQVYRTKGVKVVFGGIYASACPQDVAAYCDAVCVGEAEGLWEQIIADCASGSLQSVYQHREPVDLSLVPVADWHFVKKRNQYLYYNVMVTSRGCPFRCEFCYNSSEYVSGKYRNRPVADVVQEIDRIGSREIMFIDDNLIGNFDWLATLLPHLKERGIIWHGAVSTNLVHHPEWIENMAQSGCRSLFVGFESINSNSIKSVNKRQNKVDDYEKLIAMLHHHGIMVNASLVFGFDGDTTDTFDATLQWLIKNRVETMTGHILTPYPGTVLYKRFEAEGRITSRNLLKYNTSHVVFQPAQMTPEELQTGYVNMYRKFYTLQNIIRRRPQNRKIVASYFLFNFGYRKFGCLTSFLGTLGLMNTIGRLARKLSYNI
jgi:radical SAM superfamily enzyme YgiQ (UPF0313 family)